MATPTIKIDQATLGAGTAGQSRTDGITGQLVTLTNPAHTSADSHSWEVRAPDGSSVSVSTSGSGNETATFTPSLVGNYIIFLTVTESGGSVVYSYTTNSLSEKVSDQGGLRVADDSGWIPLGDGETQQFNSSDGWHAAWYAMFLLLIARVPKYNTAASAAPTTGDDTDDGYAVGSRWWDTTNDEEYVCLDASSGAAVWVETTAADHGALSGLADDDHTQYARTDGTRELTGGQGGGVTALTPGATVTPDASADNGFTLSPDQDFTLNAPTNAHTHQVISIQITQDSTARTISFGAGITEQNNGTAIALSTSSGAIDVLTLVTFDGGTTWRATIAKEE